MNLEEYRLDVLKQGREGIHAYFLSNDINPKTHVYHLRVVGWGVDEEAEPKYQNQLRVRGEIVPNELSPDTEAKIMLLGLKRSTFTAFLRNNIEFTFEFNYADGN